MTPGPKFTYWSILKWCDKLGKIDTERNQRFARWNHPKSVFRLSGKKQKQIHLCTANFEKHCTAKIACMMAVILLNLNLGLQDSLSSEPCVLNLLKIYFARLHALVRICSLLSMPRFSLGFQASVWLFGIEID